MLLDGERWEPISSQYQIIVSHLPEKKISVPILVQVVVPFPLSGAAGICQDIFMQ